LGIDNISLKPLENIFPSLRYTNMCGSPAYLYRDFMETLNTLKYANRARNIKNKEQTMKFFLKKIILRDCDTS
jgi:hypothetical protein